MEEKNDTAGEAIDHEIVSHIFVISAAMVGVCLTAIGLVKIVTKRHGIETIADDLLAFNACLFVTCCFAAFWSFRTRHKRRRGSLETFVERAFLAGLALMVVICAIIVYSIT